MRQKHSLACTPFHKMSGSNRHFHYYICRKLSINAEQRRDFSKGIDKTKFLWYNMYGNKFSRFKFHGFKKCPRETVKSYPGDFFMYARAHGTGSAYRLSPPSSHLRIISTINPASMDISRFNKCATISPPLVRGSVVSRHFNYNIFVVNCQFCGGL